LTKGDVVIAKKPKNVSTITSVSSTAGGSTTSVSTSRATAIGWKIYQRFHFSSALKRMSVVAGHTKPGATETSYIATCKGAPEILKSMVHMAKFLIFNLIIDWSHGESILYLFSKSKPKR
jgi:magnesium-transporting ATPase (P-type)